jgi:copper transport protein
MVRTLAAAAAAIALLVTVANPAGAHATVSSSTPGDHEHVATAPKLVSIQFSEPVSIKLGGLTVIDAKGNRVDNGDNSQPTSDRLESTLKPNLGDGTYVANYAIISADGHAVRGSVIFGVGNGSLSDVSTLATTTDPKLDALSKVGQFLTYLGVMLAAGLAFFAAFIFGDGPERPRLARLTRIAVAIGAAGIALTVLSQAALETGNGLGSFFDTAVAGTVLSEGLGWQCGVQIAGLIACLISLTPTSTVSSKALALYGGVAATGSFVLFGHATQSPHPWLTEAADVVHVAVGALWLGGLVGLALVVRSRLRTTAPTVPADGPSPTDDRPLGRPPAAGPGTATAVLDRTEVGTRTEVETEVETQADEPFRSTIAVVDRFSSAAAISVALLTAAGLTLGIIEVGSVSNLVSTSYGQLVIAKVVVVAFILAMAAYNRYRLLPRLGATADDTRAGLRSLVRALRFEALGIVAVLAITAVLANTTPSASLPAPPTPFAATSTVANTNLSLSISPNQAGSNQADVQFTDASGAPVDTVQAVGLYLTLPAKNVGPLVEDMPKVGPGHYQLSTPDLSIAGDWTVTLQVRVDEFTQKDVDFRDTVTG